MAALLAVGLCAAATPVLASPATYTMVVDGAAGSINGTAFSARVVTLTINADTTAVTTQTMTGDANSRCVTGPGTVSVAGVASGTFVSGEAYFCTQVDGETSGFYTSLAQIGSNPVHGGANGDNTTGRLTGAPFAAPGVTLIDNFGPVSYLANTHHSHGARGSLQADILLVGGGRYAATAPEASGSTTASTLTVTVMAVNAVPTLSEWAMILFGTLLAGAAALIVQRRRAI
ncbi:IPTL-CTERM sorting domain-containing protein [Brevundimonas sp.]|uniref:IPTL-CTERM sorting domain-containing protein n=1 Tax=Brevundimonas sp. TaxID=1871086 RepID=UPI003D0D4A0F